MQGQIVSWREKSAGSYGSHLYEEGMRALQRKEEHRLALKAEIEAKKNEAEERELTFTPRVNRASDVIYHGGSVFDRLSRTSGVKSNIASSVLARKLALGGSPSKPQAVLSATSSKSYTSSTAAKFTPPKTPISSALKAAVSRPVEMAGKATIISTSSVMSTSAPVSRLSALRPSMVSTPTTPPPSKSTTVSSSASRNDRTGVPITSPRAVRRKDIVSTGGAVSDRKSLSTPPVTRPSTAAPSITISTPTRKPIAFVPAPVSSTRPSTIAVPSVSVSGAQTPSPRRNVSPLTTASRGSPITRKSPSIPASARIPSPFSLSARVKESTTVTDSPKREPRRKLSQVSGDESPVSPFKTFSSSELTYDETTSPKFLPRKSVSRMLSPTKQLQRHTAISPSNGSLVALLKKESPLKEKPTARSPRARVSASPGGEPLSSPRARDTSRGTLATFDVTPALGSSSSPLPFVPAHHGGVSHHVMSPRSTGGVSPPHNLSPSNSPRGTPKSVLAVRHAASPVVGRELSPTAQFRSTLSPAKSIIRSDKPMPMKLASPRIVSEDAVHVRYSPNLLQKAPISMRPSSSLSSPGKMSSPGVSVRQVSSTTASKNVSSPVVTSRNVSPRDARRPATLSPRAVRRNL